MTLITGDKILACPHCGHLYKNHIIASFNTLNVDIYSDGHMEGMLPNFVSVIKCVQVNCQKFFNIEEAEELGEIPFNDDANSFPEEWKDATPLHQYRISATELEECLATDFCNDYDKEITVRTLLQRRYNDAFRKDRDHQHSPEEETSFVNNIDRLIELQKDIASHAAKINLAELYREKGDFKSCIQLLEEIKGESDNEKDFKEKIYSQAKVQDNKVFDLNRAAVKKEYQCNSCGHSLILFDLDKLNNSLDYHHFRCQDDNMVFDAPTKINNPVKYYDLTFWQKLFKLKEPYQSLIPNNDIICPQCSGRDIEVFNPESHVCIKCGSGDYEGLNWV